MRRLTGSRPRHPGLVTWVLLSLGMILILLVTAWDAGLTAGQLAWLVVACVGLAGLCTWIIGWE